MVEINFVAEGSTWEVIQNMTATTTSPIGHIRSLGIGLELACNGSY